MRKTKTIPEATQDVQKKKKKKKKKASYHKRNFKSRQAICANRCDERSNGGASVGANCEWKRLFQRHSAQANHGHKRRSDNRRTLHHNSEPSAEQHREVRREAQNLDNPRLRASVQHAAQHLDEQDQCDANRNDANNQEQNAIKLGTTVSNKQMQSRKESRAQILPNCNVAPAMIDHKPLGDAAVDHAAFVGGVANLLLVNRNEELHKRPDHCLERRLELEAFAHLRAVGRANHRVRNEAEQAAALGVGEADKHLDRHDHRHREQIENVVHSGA